MSGFNGISSSIPVVNTAYQTAGHGTAQTGIIDPATPAELVDAVFVTNADTAIAHLTLYYYIAGTYYPIGSCSVPIGAGTVGAPSFDALANCLPTGYGSLVVPTHTGLAFALDANLLTGQLTCVAVGGYC